MSRPRRALLSVSDKTGLVELARGLVELGFELVSTGGTKSALAAAGLPVTAVADVTGHPEILGGRVKTLHPRIHGGILADRAEPSHLAELEVHGIAAIDLVAVNLYPFCATVARPEVTFAEAIENIDIGGPAMVRAAAKNHASVVVVVDPEDYASVVAGLAAGGPDAATRRELARRAFAHTAAYDAAIADWTGWRAADDAADSGAFPARLELRLERALLPRYGENPHQSAATYALVGGPGLLGGMEQIQGKELSWNNLLDADAAKKLVALFPEPAVVVVKHNNPCGVARGDDLVAAYRRALAADPVSAFGSIIAVNRAVDGELARAMADLFVEVLVAPEIDAEARAVLATRKSLRVLASPIYAATAGEIELRGIAGGFLAQSPDGLADDLSAWSSPTRRSPSPAERRGLELAWRVARYVKSNAIVVADAVGTIGVGAGQMSRVDSCRLAVGKAALPVAGAVAASDAFFPFRDGLDVLADAGVTAIVHPGGSKRDDEIVAAADERGLALVVTGVRHFRH